MSFSSLEQKNRHGKKRRNCRLYINSDLPKAVLEDGRIHRIQRQRDEAQENKITQKRNRDRIIKRLSIEIIDQGSETTNRNIEVTKNISILENNNNNISIGKDKLNLSRNKSNDHINHTF